ncbi:MAG: NTP transferase domain-containing protein [Myxococcota bacterium]|nr:NTP transferase domain-containing protein [Myxococcota bacterium]
MNRTDRTGVILAAGFGTRLKGVSDDTELKPLTPVCGKPLLVRTVESLERAGCARVVIVVGHGAQEVEADFRAVYPGEAEVLFAVNDRYELSNGLSVLAARPHVPGDFVLTMADHILGAEVMALASEHVPPVGGATLLVDHKLDTIFDMDDATKVLASPDGRIDAIGKQIPTYNCIDTGVFICTQGLMDAIQTTFEAHGDASLSHGVATLSGSGRMTVRDIGDGFWQDVDTPEMLAHAEEMLRQRSQSESRFPPNA